MLNGVNLNYIVVLLVSGAVLLAAIYHTILFAHRKTALLGSYSAYLWATFFYCGFRAVYFFNSDEASSVVNLDEVLQMFAFILYVHFGEIAFQLNRQKDKYAFLFVRITPYVVLFYLAVNTYLVNASGGDTIYIIAKIAVRLYLLIMGLLIVFVTVRKRHSIFFQYLAAGIFSMIVFGFLSSTINIMGTQKFLLGAISWLMLGFFTDVIFFSSAIGYRIRQEHDEREESLKQLIEKEAELQQKEIENLKLAFETREEERMRIAKDLHDDMGSTLSSINIYSNVVNAYMETDKKKAHDYLEKIQYNARLLMDNATDLIWSLQTNYGEAESIFKRMQKTAVEMLSSANITPQINIAADELPHLHIAAQKNCWLIFKEAVNNVCKYSNASTCIISIKTENEKLIISVSDDGVGFANPTLGNGLKNMKSRTADLMGDFNIESETGAGTVLKITLPVDSISLKESL